MIRVSIYRVPDEPRRCTINAECPDVPWTFADGKGKTPLAALKLALGTMQSSDQASLRLLFNPPDDISPPVRKS